MFRRRAPNKFVAWLAMLAICLLAAVPTVSRVIAATTVAAEIGCVEHVQSDHRHGKGEDQRPADGLDACSYCALAAHGSFLGSAIACVVPLVPAAPLAVAVDRRAVVVAAVRCPPARGPPAAASNAALA